MKGWKWRYKEEADSTPAGSPKREAPPGCHAHTPRGSKRSRGGSDCRVRVGVRVRPGGRRLDGDSARVRVGPSASFSFDRVFLACESQSQLFAELARPLLLRAVEGYNVCLFAYGQTGTGKTYSMMGPSETLLASEAGIIPRFCQELFQIVDKSTSTFQVNASYYEIYNEKIHDLLSRDKIIKKALRVREHPVDGPYVENLSIHRIASIDEAIKLLISGNGRRATAETSYNDRSSRSHSIFELTVSSCKDDILFRSKVSLVDLAGSERLAVGEINSDRYREGLSINKSLLTLGKVITALSDPKGAHFIPYRESILTWLLKGNLGQNSYTTMLATINPDEAASEETLATLRYACQAREIINAVSINEDPQHKIIRELRIEIEKLKSLQDVIANGNDSGLNEKINEIDRMYPSTGQNDTLENQEGAVNRLREELDRLTNNLEAAEKRRDELEKQKNMQIENLKSGDVSFYNSNFYDNLKDILDDSFTLDGQMCTVPNKSLNHVLDIQRSLESLFRICTSNMDDDIYSRRVLPLIVGMRLDSVKLNDIIKSYPDPSK